MSENENAKPGCLATIFGLLFLFYSVYTPVYFFILNNEVDAVQEASLLDFLFAPTRLVLEIAKANGPLKELDRLADNSRADVKSVQGIDIGVSFEKMLSKNKAVENVDFYEAGNNGGLSRVVTEFTIRDVGRVKMVSMVKSRSFFKVGLTQFITIDTVSLNNEWVNSPETFIARHVYGITNEKTLSAITAMTKELPR